MPAHEIIIKNPIWAECGPVLAAIIKPCLSFKAAYWRQGPFKKERKEYDKTFLNKGKGGVHFFWAGLTAHVLDYCTSIDVDVNLKDQSQEEIMLYEPELPGITFRPDQLHLINSFLDQPRGILVSFTGSGKTVLGFGILSSFENVKILWLCHKKDLMMQAYDEAIRFGFKSVGRYGDGFKEINKDIVIATRQSFKTIADTYGHEFDVIVVDEVHHVADIKSEYAYVLSKTPAPIRLGLTATIPREGEAYLTAVGLIGPILEEMTINKGAELGILAKPTIKILRVPKNYDMAQMRVYHEVYDMGVVRNLARNILIAKTAKKHVDADETVLIMINILDHGYLILEQLKAMGVNAEFVHGATDGESRNKLKHALNEGHIKCVICSSVWTEGVNIPNLNAVICASGGKSEIKTLQSIGRGLRKTKDKDAVYIYDFLDTSHKFLIEHFGERMICYSENDWI